MKYIDIHCHLNSKDFYNDRKEVLARMREKEVGAIAVGADLEESKKAVEIAEESEKTGNKIWACVGAHPEEVSKGTFDIGEMDLLQKMATSATGRVVGIGECGLDYFRIENEEIKKLQKELFKFQIQFAIGHDKSLMLHVRDAYDDAIQILKNYKKEAGEKLRGNVHFFAGDIEIAKKFLDLGFTMSFTGVITFTHDYDEVIKYIPNDSIMSETDAPFVSPVPFRGQRNEPCFVIEVVKKMAEIRNQNEDDLRLKILENAKRVFGLPN